jgi:alkylation response protein AidB-like acyl-CoA dehydrogenase
LPGLVGLAGFATMRGRPETPTRTGNYYRYSVIDAVGAGTSEVQRNIIARRGLRLPVEN